MSSTQPPVSAVIPTFNSARFLPDAIDSVLYQTYPSVECVVVDDGSTDDTREVCSRYGDKIVYVRTENRGVSNARNEGRARATHRYLAFLDADDLWLPCKIEYQMELVASRPDFGMVYSGYHVVDDNLEFKTWFPAPPPEDALRNTLLLERPAISLAQTAIVTVDAFDQVGGFDPLLSAAADCDLACRIAARFPVGVVDRPLVLYRRHSNQMHHDPVGMEKDMLRVFSKLFTEEWLEPDLLRLRRRAKANLRVSLAGTYLLAGDRRRFLRYAAMSLVTRPDRVIAALRRLMSPQAGMKRAH